jgi:hypothetical protein
MAKEKSILEEALLDIKNIQSALNANTKEILRSVAREEINSVVKESLVDEAYTEEAVNEEEAAETEKMTEGEMTEEGMTNEEVAEEGMESEGTYEEGMDTGVSEELDLTDASDDDVIAIYKKLSGEDEIEIVGDEVRLSVSEPGEYVIKTSDIEGAPADDMDMEMDLDVDDAEMDMDMDVDDAEMGMDGEEGGVDYEIEMGDEEETEETPFGDEEEEEEEEGEEEGEEEEEEEEVETIDEKIAVGTGMSVGNRRNPHGPGSIGAPENPKSKLDEAVIAKKLVSETAKKYNTLLTEAKKLKTENEEFRTALKEFRTKLVETVVFNSNLTYITKLFMEHATTKGEKQSIIKRFDDEATTLKESKRLYKTIANEMENRKPINEAVENKIIKEATSGASRQLTENTAYVDPSTKRILDLIKRVER